MRNIFKVFTIALFATFVLASCETYKIPETEYTNVSWLDGKYICFATNSAEKVLYELEITNTTDDAENAAWITITDYNPMHAYAGIYYAVLPLAGDAAAQYYATNYFTEQLMMPAYRFKVTCDAATKTFSCSDATAIEPKTCYNSMIGAIGIDGVELYGVPVYYAAGTGPQGYYTPSGNFGTYREYAVSISNGSIKSDVPTASGYKTDGISFDITIKDNVFDLPDQVYSVSGIRKTGWAEDVEEYVSFYQSLWDALFAE
ncbi:MAG: hypothetical protein IKX71_02605 [Bacteroidales bacterium]|nr:hypothetical protein [Bacteroidales bacterium]